MTNSIYEALLNSNAVAEFDVQGHILWANQNFLRIFGYNLAEIVGLHNSIFLPDLHQHELEYYKMWTHLTFGHPQVGEFKRVGKCKNTIWIQSSYTPIRDTKGKIVKIVETAVDITEKKTLAENLDRKNRQLVSTLAKAKAATNAKTTFLANMSHEIRTPLNSIIGITDTLAETPLDDRQASFVEILRRANSQLLTIINDILDLSKVEAGEAELKPRPFELQSVLDELIAVLNFRAKEKGLLFSVDVAPAIGTCFIGDAARLRQVLMNLINNAIKFTNQGEVSLRITANDSSRPGNLLFCVSDSGIGIPKSKLKDIFKAFTQADSTTTRHYGGTGVGLSITKNLVELMKGQIWVESVPESGSVFYFTATLPTYETQTQPPKEKGIKDSVSPQCLRILVVDDVDDNRNLLGIYLQNSGHNISYAKSGIEALAMVQRENFDVIFMDVQMPGMDGYETTRHIRALEKQKGRTGARILACTANAFAEDIEKSLQAGCDMHLSKPIRKDSVINTINSFFSL